MPLHILHIMQTKFIKKKTKEIQLEGVVSFQGGGGVAPGRVFFIITLRNVK